MPDDVKSAATGEKVKNPRSRELYEQLKAEEARLEAALAPARAVYEKKINDPELIKARQIIKETNALLGPIKNELAALARAGGAKGLKAEPGVYTKKEE